MSIGFACLVILWPIQLPSKLSVLLGTSTFRLRTLVFSVGFGQKPLLALIQSVELALQGSMLGSNLQTFLNVWD